MSFTLQTCVDAISDRISDQIGVIAGVSIAIAVLLVSNTLWWAILGENLLLQFTCSIGSILDLQAL